MLKIKNYHFLLIFIIVNILSTSLKQIFQVSISEILLISAYLFYTLLVIYKLNSIFQSLNKYFLIFCYFIYIYIFFGIYYGLYLQLSYGFFEYFKYIDSFNESLLGNMMNIVFYSSIFILIPYLLTKTIVSVEQRKVIKVADYFKEFIFAVITPIFIYKMVPRINQIYENSINGDIFVNQNENVYLTLSKNEALVFFELLSRLKEKENKELFENPAEEKVLWSIEAELEKSLSEPFSPNYLEILQKAREELRD